MTAPKVLGATSGGDVGGRVEHVARRPSWCCRACGEPWPCPPAKDQLVADFDRIGLCLYAALQLADAAADLPELTPAQLFPRFLTWARDAHRRAADQRLSPASSTPAEDPS
ncbi:hypothetical protein O7632_17690 [Solwaraspora sp. WMMD406]|uniref:hypothetical protein n=1 Tax=Solwaraspora sp. WMMD406 TaxID=3016095 RepID=UPI002415F9E5|nr:hypothetical protein [Solwaraspora sp. WMMD406]MDG4765917.1 hypothetical protein [Solwaraspora sp. WMMD406]